ncbi:MAG: ABC transporter substrate-binding protein [Balneolaceae bacterium]
MKTNVSFLLVTFLAVILSCGKSTETIIVQTGPGLFSTQTTPRETVENQKGADRFIQLNVGELEAIETLDPLFAESNSELRTIHLIYDGLTRINQDGEVAPALASSWKLSSDSLQYTFQLRTDVYFHNSSKFPSGLGRRFSAKDVEFSFRRMASVLVPDAAANKFEQIRGFENYHLEQTTVKNPAKRTLTGIDGIKVQNDSTLSIILTRKNSLFLEELAHPHASIYASESLPTEGGPILRPIGTGAFYFAKQEKNRLILASNNSYFLKQNLPDRLDIISGLSESELFLAFAKDEVDVLLELGPQSILSATDSTGQLNNTYKSVYELNISSVKGNYELFYNPKSNQPSARSFVASLPSTFMDQNGRIGTVTIPTNDGGSTEINSSPIKVANTTNPFSLYLVNELAPQFVENGITISLNASYALNNDVALSARPARNLIPILSWQVPIHLLTKKGMSGIELVKTPWNIEYDGIILPPKDE